MLVCSFCNCVCVCVSMSASSESSSIIYGLVANGADVLAEYTAPHLSGNFSQVTRVLLSRLDTHNDAKASYVLDGYHYHRYPLSF